MNKASTLICATIALSLASAAMAGEAGHLPAAGNDSGQVYPDPVKNPASPLMLAGDWLPKDIDVTKGSITKDWAMKHLPRIPSQHSIVHDVRDANGTRVNQHNYLSFHDGLYWVIWSDAPGQPNPRIREWHPDHRTRQPHHDVVPGPGQSPHPCAWTHAMVERRWPKMAANLDALAEGRALQNIVAQA